MDIASRLVITTVDLVIVFLLAVYYMTKEHRLLPGIPSGSRVCCLRLLRSPVGLCVSVCEAGMVLLCDVPKVSSSVVEWGGEGTSSSLDDA